MEVVVGGGAAMEAAAMEAAARAKGVSVVED
jgi:pyruvate/2-oxoglutarate dehydrogenase complex dihydrolipoamide dehydrogenase (E3) component